MKIIIIEDKLELNDTTHFIQKVAPTAELIGFSDPDKAFSYLTANQVEIIMLDVENGLWSGISFANKCKQIQPEINIIFITIHIGYVMDAWKLHASGYLLKPMKENDLCRELNDLRYPCNDESL